MIDKQEIVEWLKRAVKDANMSLARASILLGMPKDALSKFIRNERDISATELAKLKQILDTSGGQSTKDDARNLVYVKVIGEAEAGLWRDVTYNDFEEFEIPVIFDERHPKGSVFAMIVRGESINRKAQDGDRFTAILFDKAPRGLQAGDWVVVDRIRGDLRERTVKRAKMASDGSWELWPFSTDPKHAEPLILGEHDGERIEVYAFVIDFLNVGTRF